MGGPITSGKCRSALISTSEEKDAGRPLPRIHEKSNYPNFQVRYDPFLAFDRNYEASTRFAEYRVLFVCPRAAIHAAHAPQSLVLPQAVAEGASLLPRAMRATSVAPVSLRDVSLDYLNARLGLAYRKMLLMGDSVATGCPGLRWL